MGIVTAVDLLDRPRVNGLTRCFAIDRRYHNTNKATLQARHARLASRERCCSVGTYVGTIVGFISAIAMLLIQ